MNLLPTHWQWRAVLLNRQDEAEAIIVEVVGIGCVSRMAGGSECMILVHFNWQLDELVAFEAMGAVETNCASSVMTRSYILPVGVNIGVA